jgi:hypothetical protein
MRRAAYLGMYAAFAALGIAVVARPASLWVRSLGLSGPTLAWDVPLGALSFALAVALALFTVSLAVAAARGMRPRVPVHAAFLLLVASCLGARMAAPQPEAPRDPSPLLLDALARVAEELDARWERRYVPDAGTLNAVLFGVAETGFRRNGRPLKPHARVLSGAAGPQLERLPEDEPGTIYVAVSGDRQSAWLTVLGGLGGVLTLANGKPAVIEARSGTHNLPGRDPLVPAYPRAHKN